MHISNQNNQPRRQNQHHSVNTKLKQPVTPFQITHSHPKSSKIDPPNQLMLCADIVKALTSSKPADAQKYISMLTNKRLREDFHSLNRKYQSIVHSQKSQSDSINAMNELLKDLTSDQIFYTWRTKQNDGLKLFDQNMLTKVLRMTNDSKIFTFIVQNKGMKFNKNELASMASLKSQLLFSTLNELFDENNNLRRKCNDQQRNFNRMSRQIQQLNEQMNNLTKKINQQSRTKYSKKGIEITSINKKIVQNKLHQSKAKQHPKTQHKSRQKLINSSPEIKSQEQIQIQQLQYKRFKLESQIIHLEEENRSLRKQEGILQQSHQKLNSTIAQLQSQLVKQTASLKAIIEKEKNINYELNKKYSRKLEETEAKYQQTQQQNAKLSKEIQELIIKVRPLQALKDSRVSKIREYELRIADLQNNLTTVRQLHRKMDQERSKQQTKIEKIQNQNDQLKNINGTLDAKAKNQQKQLQQLQKIKDEASKIKAKETQLRSIINTKDIQMQKLTQANYQISKRNQELRQKKQEFLRQIQSQKNQIVSLQSEKMESRAAGHMKNKEQNQQLEKINSQIIRLKDLVTDKAKRIVQAQQAYHLLEQKHTKLRIQVQQAQSQIQSLRKSNELLTFRLLTEQKENQSIKSKNKLMQTERQQLTKNLNEQQNNVAELKSINLGQMMEIQHQSDEIKKLVDASNQLKTQLSKLGSKNAQMEKIHSQLLRKLKEQSSLKQEYIQKLSTAEQQIHSFLVENRQINLKNQQLTSQVTKLQQQISIINHQNQRRLSEKKEEIPFDLYSQNSEPTQWNEREDYCNKIAQLKNKVQKYAREAESVSAEYSKVQSIISQLKSEKQQLQNSIISQDKIFEEQKKSLLLSQKQLQSNVQRIMKSLSKKQSQCKELQSARQKMKGQLSGNEKTIQGLSETIQAQVSKEKLWKKEEQNLSNKNKQYQKEIGLLKIEIKNYQTVVRNSKEENNGLNLQIIKLNQTIDSKTKQLIFLQSENASIKQKITQKEQYDDNNQVQNTKWKKDNQLYIESLQKQIETQKTTISKQSSTVKSLAAQLENAQRDYKERLQKIQNHNKELLSRITVLQTQKYNASNLILTLKGELTDKQFLLQKLGQENEKTIQRLQSINGEQFNKASEEIKRLTVVNSKKEEIINNIGLELKEMKILNQLQTKQLQNHKKCRITFDQLENKANGLKEQNKNLKLQVQNCQQRQTNLKTEVDRLDVLRKKLEMDLENSNGALKNITEVHQKTLQNMKIQHQTEIKLVQNQLNKNGEIEILSKNILTLKDEYNKLDQENIKLKSSFYEQIKLIQNENAFRFQAQMDNLNAHWQKVCSERTNILRNQIASLQAERQKVKSTNETDRRKFQRKIKQYEQEIEHLTHQVEMLNNTLEQVTKLNQSADAKDNEDEAIKVQTQKIVNQQHQHWETEIKRREEKITQLNSRLAQFAAELKSSQEKNIDMQMQMNNLQGQINDLKVNVESLNVEISVKNEELTSAKQQMSLISKEHSQYVLSTNKQLQSFEQRTQMLERQLHSRIDNSDRAIASLFQHELLQYYPEHKKFLKQSIEGRMGSRILKTKLIYRYDPLSKVNFHSYIDGKENLVLIVKLANGYFIAAYTEDPFLPKRPSQGDGLIISLTNKEVFTLIEPNRRAIAYDEYYMLFGNSEVRLKSQEKKFFSNFGINNSYYATRGFRVSALLGTPNNERQTNLESYEIYQLEMIYDL